MANSNPLLDPGQGFTGIATGAAVVGGRFLKAAGPKVDGEPIPVAHCGASDHPIGVAGADRVQDGDVTVYPIQVQKVEAGGTVTAGLAVEVMSGGKVQNLASGRKVGVAWETGVNGDFVLVQPLI